MVFRRLEQAGFAEHAREGWRLLVITQLGTFHEFVDLSRLIRHHVELASVRFAESRDVEGCVVELLVPGDFLVLTVVAQRPNLAGFPVCVDVRADQILETRAVVDEAARHRARFAVRVRNDGR